MSKPTDKIEGLKRAAVSTDSNCNALGIVAFGDFLEVYSATNTVRMQNLFSGSPSPQTPIVMTNAPNAGSRHPVVARVLLQSCELVEKCGIPGSAQTAAKLSLLACKDSLIACEKTAKTVKEQVNAICDQLKKDGLIDLGNSLHLPHVEGLSESATAYLINIKRAIRAICDVVRCILGLDGKDNNFEALARRLRAKYGEQHELVKFVEHHAPAVKHIILLRNNDEHSGVDDTYTVVRNFHLAEGRQIKAPTWHVEGKITTAPQWVVNEMWEFLQLTAMLAEAAVILAVRARIKYPLVVAQVPKEQISPDWPVAWRLTFDPAGVRLG